jgi:uncharacterized protein (TIGR03435 family)
MAFRLSSLRRLLLIAAASFTITSLAQNSASPAASISATPSVVFEVAAIKLNQSGSGGSDSGMSNGRFSAKNVSLKSIMEHEAFSIPESRILGGPKWLSSTRFDVEAKMDDAAADHLQTLSKSARRLTTETMFQQLLAERFHLVVHWETRDLAVYALMVAKKGPKLQPTKESTGSSSTSSHTTRSGSQFTARGVTMAQLADALTQESSRELGRDVVDQTEITGRYDVSLEWTRDNVASVDGAAPSGDSGPSIFTAIQEQLGLKLESAKAPVQVLVIDRAEMPSEN